MALIGMQSEIDTVLRASLFRVSVCYIHCSCMDDLLADSWSMHKQATQRTTLSLQREVLLLLGTAATKQMLINVTQPVMDSKIMR